MVMTHSRFLIGFLTSAFVMSAIAQDQTTPDTRSPRSVEVNHSIAERGCPFRIHNGRATGKLGNREEMESYRWSTSCEGFVNVRVTGSAVHFRLQELSGNNWRTIADSQATGTNTYLPMVGAGTYRIVTYNSWTRSVDFEVAYSHGIG
ncbi:hypothetical protein FHW69_000932 [Luteibacter sp. Sphag1AF]|uniref:hypothetical protein n=1 Tax=Luteibacter sp. Sphag1AF TaxID=2587031 RepID=UPI0016208B7A|nr:hypothetical protein [Luteibacter sp. Sphag1AF]MBB3226342.1 hypothetical protein [Luteibacter sp. Sphag1AF]